MKPASGKKGKEGLQMSREPRIEATEGPGYLETQVVPIDALPDSHDNPIREESSTQHEALLGKRLFSESSLHELEQVDVRKSIPAEINSVDPAGPSGQTLSTNIAALKVDFFSKMVNMVVDERLQQRAKWKGDLKKKNLYFHGDELREVPSMKPDTKLLPTQIKPLKKPEELPAATIKKKFELMMEEDLSKDRVMKRDNPLKAKSPSCDDIYYPEDFLIKGLFPPGSKWANKRYVDLRAELAHPLSQNVVLRNENTVSLNNLEGRMFKYLEESAEVRTLQFLGCSSEDVAFVDICSNGTISVIAEETVEDKFDRKRLFLMQTPVFVYLEDKKQENIPLLQAIKDDSKLSFLEHRGEYVWPAFLLCEQDEEISSQLLQMTAIKDSFGEIEITKALQRQSEEGVLVSYFGTNLFSRVEYSNIIPFETIVNAALLQKLKKDCLALKFIKLSLYYFRVLAEKEVDVTSANCKDSVHHLVTVENSLKGTRSFAVILSVSKNYSDRLHVFVRYLEAENPQWIALDDKNYKVRVSFNLPEISLNNIKSMKNESSSYSTNKTLTNIINNFLGDYYTGHNKSIDFTRKATSRNSLDQELISSDDRIRKCLKCNYTISLFDGLKCQNCLKVYHKFCLESQKALASGTALGEKYSVAKGGYWACPDCRECRYCLSFRNRDQMQACIECGSFVHPECVLSSLPSSSQGANMYSRKYFRCDDCLKCHNCEAIIEDDNYHKLEHKNVKFCRLCYSLYVNKQCCPICCKAHLSKVKNLKTKKFAKDLFACECGFWIHEDCDPLLKRNPVNLSKARSKDTTYNCPRCRTDIKNKQCALFVDILIRLDIRNLFTMEIDKREDAYYKTIKNPIFLSTMLKKAKAGFYETDSYSKLKEDFDLLWKNIDTFNMPATQELLEGYKLYLLAQQAFKEFAIFLHKSTEDYLFDDNTNFIVRKFYDFKNSIIRDYLNIVAKDYEIVSGGEIPQVSAMFEEKDKRSITSKERNKLNHLLSVKKMKQLDIDDLYENSRLVFDLESKSLTIEIKGVNMLKMNYSEIDLTQASPALRAFLKQNSNHIKRSVAKTHSEFLEQPLVLEERGSHREEEEHEDKYAIVLSHEDYQLMTQLEFWLIEHKETIDNQFHLSDNSIPISIKTSYPSEVCKAVCLISGTLSQLEPPNASELISCVKCGEFFTKDFLFPREPKSPIDPLHYVCPSCLGCQICHGKQYNFVQEKGYLREANYNLIMGCSSCYDQYHFSCVYPKVVRTQHPPFLTLWRCEKCFE